MTRPARAEVFDPSEVAVLHLRARVVHKCFLFGVDPEHGSAMSLGGCVCSAEIVDSG